MALALSALEAKGKAEDEEAESRAHSLKNKIKLSRKEILIRDLHMKADKIFVKMAPSMLDLGDAKSERDHSMAVCLAELITQGIDAWRQEYVVDAQDSFEEAQEIAGSHNENVGIVADLLELMLTPDSDEVKAKEREREGEGQGQGKSEDNDDDDEDEDDLMLPVPPAQVLEVEEKFNSMLMHIDTHKEAIENRPIHHAPSNESKSKIMTMTIDSTIPSEMASESENTDANENDNDDVEDESERAFIPVDSSSSASDAGANDQDTVQPRSRRAGFIDASSSKVVRDQKTLMKGIKPLKITMSTEVITTCANLLSCSSCLLSQEQETSLHIDIDKKYSAYSAYSEYSEYSESEYPRRLVKHQYFAGERVEANYRSRGRWYNGTIKLVKLVKVVQSSTDTVEIEKEVEEEEEDAVYTYCVQYDDGERERLSKENLRCLGHQRDFALEAHRFRLQTKEKELEAKISVVQKEKDDFDTKQSNHLKQRQQESKAAVERAVEVRACYEEG